MRPILEGIRVLDVGSFVFGPAAATVMADFGADVREDRAAPDGGSLPLPAPDAAAPEVRGGLLLAADGPRQAQRRARSEGRRGARDPAAPGARVRRLRHQLSGARARRAAARLARPRATESASRVCPCDGLRRGRARSREARLRRHGLVGALGAAGLGAAAGRRARPVGARHGGPSERDGAIRRDHAGPLPAGADGAAGARCTARCSPTAPGRTASTCKPCCAAPRAIATSTVASPTTRS